MPEIGFNPNALSVSFDPENRHVRCSLGDSAFQPVVVDAPGVQAIVEGLRLANIKCDVDVFRKK